MNQHAPPDDARQAELISLTNALVAALESDDADTEFMEQTRQFVDQLGDTLTLPVSAVLNLDQLEQQERRQLLEENLRQLGLQREGLDWSANPEQAVEFQNRIWIHLHQRFLHAHQVITSHIELPPGSGGGYSRPMHTPPGSWLLLFAESGQCAIQRDTDRSAEHLALGSDGPAVLLQPPESSIVVNSGPGEAVCSLFSSAFFPPQHWQELLQGGGGTGRLSSIAITDPTIAAYLAESFGRIIDIAHSSAHYSRALHLNLLEHILLLCDEQQPRQQRELLDRRVIAARDFLLAHYREKTTVEQVAAAANAAPSTLNALFKSQMGENLMRWRDQLRMQRARELLQGGDQPIKVIAAEVGYDDPMFFSRRFKQITGWSPTQIRHGKTL
ncbi:helix-turn-helix domain-containing protein [Parahaliea maris]|uniref:Helix-turn-helix domain-containing protein n=1 Tax=Parahaliea maris TaxID=2716870 RepID=A0A5C9A6E0_9GAMM|nr:helix-turn-helix domain-containing protein [Parahaliea maris]TXS96495.1 helix-turn-helix domain-containing protein [Parahaliea maris]